MSDRVAIIGVGWVGFQASTPDSSYKELIYAAATRAYQDAGVNPRRDIESFVTVAEDFNEGTSIFDEYTPDQLGAVLKPMQTITGDGLHGLATAHMLIRTGQFSLVAVEGHSKASNILTSPQNPDLPFQTLPEPGPASGSFHACVEGKNLSCTVGRMCHRQFVDGSHLQPSRILILRDRL